MSFPSAQAARADTPTPPSLINIIDTVRDVARASDCVTIGAVIKAVGHASFAPILLLPALAVATPLSGVPLFSSLMGVIIFLVAIQMLFRRDQLWLPDWILQREVRGKIVFDAFNYLIPAAVWLDNRTNKRLKLLVRRPLIFVPQFICMMSGALMPLLEFVPFSSSVMGVGVAILALGMLSRDGLIILLGLVPYGVVVWLVTLAIG